MKVKKTTLVASFLLAIFVSLSLFAISATVSAVPSNEAAPDCAGTVPAAYTGACTTPGTTACWSTGQGDCSVTCQGTDGRPGNWGAPIPCPGGRVCDARMSKCSKPGNSIDSVIQTRITFAGFDLTNLKLRH